MQEKIDFIYKHKNILSRIFHSENNTFDHNTVFFSNKTESYIGISQGYDEHITVKVIFIDNGVWQYNYFSSQPIEHKYISLDEYLDILINKIKEHENRNNKE